MHDDDGQPPLKEYPPGLLPGREIRKLRKMGLKVKRQRNAFDRAFGAHHIRRTLQDIARCERINDSGHLVTYWGRAGSREAQAYAARKQREEQA